MNQPSDRCFPIGATRKKPGLFRAAGFLLLLLAGTFIAPPASAQPTNQQAQIDALNAERNDAMEQVRKIVNQPVTRLVRQPGMSVAEYSPGWFHEGANIPDFNHVDVRTSQELIYAQHVYVTSDLNPGMVFLGRELEFNANTKYFYTDRSLPKKRLTEPEMLEINRLYRIIGRCEQQLAQVQMAEPAPGTTEENIAGAILTRFPILKSTPARVTLVVLLLLAMVYLFRRRTA
jgi:hypothetical protein